MEPEPRNRISDLYHAALARSPEERGAFLNEACAGDDALRREVESLLACEPQSSGFLERPAGLVAGVVSRAADRMTMIDRQLGPYTIIAPLGAGGMGEVYRARDSKLGRDVALKILPSHFTSDPERRARFTREARLLATLNHPHIGGDLWTRRNRRCDARSCSSSSRGRRWRNASNVDRCRSPRRSGSHGRLADALDAAHQKGHRSS